MENPLFIKGDISTHFIEDMFKEKVEVEV